MCDPSLGVLQRPSNFSACVRYHQRDTTSGSVRHKEEREILPACEIMGVGPDGCPSQQVAEGKARDVKPRRQQQYGASDWRHSALAYIRSPHSSPLTNFTTSHFHCQVAWLMG
jgi:hypothetical protein